MKFEHLVKSIQVTSEHLQESATKAVNVYLTVRNWMAGFYIVEYEQKGEDRAVYGTRLIKELSKAIKVRGLSDTNLKICRQFYVCYPQIMSVVLDGIKNTLPEEINVIIEERVNSNVNPQISQTLSDQFDTMGNVDVEESLSNEDLSYQQKLFVSISFSHFTELVKISDPIKRKFYELFVLKTTPTVRELERSIDTLTYERLGLSRNKELALKDMESQFKPSNGEDVIKSHYFLEFLGYKSPELVEESDLESALLKNLQNFILELGKGFCFEGKQKRLLIGDEYFFVDLVFYHRVLKCHVLVELKTDKAKSEHIGQLKCYLEYYKRHEMLKGDNPPVGILLVTKQNKALVEYAIADKDKEIFVRDYLFELPDKNKLASFIERELKRC